MNISIPSMEDIKTDFVYTKFNPIIGEPTYETLTATNSQLEVKLAEITEHNINLV